jgi:hypothetical protein
MVDPNEGNEETNMSFDHAKSKIYRTALLAFTLGAGVGCTQTVPNQFKLLPADDSSAAATEVHTLVSEKHGAKIDILWVIDNSASMLTSQTKLKNGLATFAKDYLTQPGTDIQLGVITTDTFVANPAWQKYLQTEIPAKGNKTPLQLHERPANQRQWGPDYAKLSASALMSTKSKSGLLANFQSRVLVGTTGIYEEHGFDSVEEFLGDNERGSSPNKLFRKGSQRIIIFLSDEDDQSVGDDVGPEPRKLLYSGSYYTGKDEVLANKILPPQFTIHCKGTPNVKGQPITADTAMTLCLRDGTAEPVGPFKSRLDAFFRDLDGNPNGNPNYLVTAIVVQDPKTLEDLRRKTKETDTGTKAGLTVITNEIGTRYIDLANQVGNGSFAMDIGASDYSPILKKIGLEIVKHSMVTENSPNTDITLNRVPDMRERFVVTLVNSAGATTVLASRQYQVTGNHVVLTDKALIAVLQPGDRISVQYQPSTVLPASK